MREIKFRVWDKDLKEWYKSTQLVIRPYSGSVTDGGIYPNVELIQYTGLKDKNGREIYEGDVIEFYDFWDEISGGNMEGKTRVGAVEYIGTGFRVTCPGDYEEDLFVLKINDDELEIIGNVYENPELLGDDK